MSQTTLWVLFIANALVMAALLWVAVRGLRQSEPAPERRPRRTPPVVALPDEVDLRDQSQEPAQQVVLPGSEQPTATSVPVPRDGGEPLPARPLGNLLGT